MNKFNFSEDFLERNNFVIKTYQKEIHFLYDKKTHKIHHGNKNLLSHLIGTAQLLYEHGRDDIDQKTGLFHSIYKFNNAEELEMPMMNNQNKRNIIKELIGEESEYLVFLFETIENRPKLLLKNIFDKKIMNRLRWVEFCNYKDCNLYDPYVINYKRILNIDEKYSFLPNYMNFF